MSQSDITEVYDEDVDSVMIVSPPSVYPHVSALSKLTSAFRLLLLVLSSSVALISLPVYLQRVAAVSHVYSALVLTSIFNPLLLLGILVIARFLFTQSSSLKPPLGWINTLVCSLALAVIGLLVFFLRDQNKVSCNLQDPIFVIAIPVSQVLYFVLRLRAIHTKVLNSTLIVFLGVFLTTEYQMCNFYFCRGFEILDPSQSTTSHSSLQSFLTKSLYLVSIALWCLMWARLELLLFGKSRVGLFTILNKQESDEELLLQDDHVPQLSVFDSLQQLFWILLGSAVTILLLFWTALFTAETMLTIPELMSKILRGVYCHFRTNEECLNVLPWAWLFKVSASSALVAQLFVLRTLRSSLLTVCVSSIALFLTSIFWSLFSMTPTQVIWEPRMDTAVLFNLLGMIVATVGFICIMWHRRTAVQTKPLPSANVL